MVFYSAIAEATRAELLQAALDNDPIAVNSTSTEAITLLAAKPGFKAAVIGYNLTGAHANDEAKFTYGSAPTDISGKIVDGAVNAESTVDKQLVYAAPVNEALKLSTTVTTSIVGQVQVAYIKVRG